MCVRFQGYVWKQVVAWEMGLKQLTRLVLWHHHWTITSNPSNVLCWHDSRREILDALYTYSWLWFRWLIWKEIGEMTLNLHCLLSVNQQFSKMPPRYMYTCTCASSIWYSGNLWVCLFFVFCCFIWGLWSGGRDGCNESVQYWLKISLPVNMYVPFEMVCNWINCQWWQ